MKAFVSGLVLALSFPTSVLAQASGGSVHGEFYAFTAPIVSNTQSYFDRNGNPSCFGTGLVPSCFSTAVGGNNTGFGLELILPKNVGAETEFSYAGADWNFSGVGGAVGIGSVDPTYHFLGRKGRKRIDPFAVGGYSLYFGDRTSFRSGYNFGGGLNFWVLKHLALRSELLYQGRIDLFNSQFNHFVAFRFGITVR